MKIMPPSTIYHIYIASEVPIWGSWLLCFPLSPSPTRSLVGSWVLASGLWFRLWVFSHFLVLCWVSGVLWPPHDARTRMNLVLSFRKLNMIKRHCEEPAVFLLSLHLADQLIFFLSIEFSLNELAYQRVRSILSLVADSGFLDCEDSTSLCYLYTAFWESHLSLGREYMERAFLSGLEWVHWSRDQWKR